MKKVISLGLLIILTGCGSVYNSYNPYARYMVMAGKNKYKRSNSISTYDYNSQNLNYFLSQGYKMVAHTSIRSTYIGVDLAEEAGQRKGATVLLYKQVYVGTATGTRVLPWYHEGGTYTVKENTQGTINVGSNGYTLDSNYSGTGSYSQSTTTTIKAPNYYTYHKVGYSHDYYDQYAMYLTKEEVKPVGKQMTLKNKCPMWDKPDLLAGKYIGDTESTEIYVIEKTNSEFYLVQSGNKTGYIFTNNFE